MAVRVIHIGGTARVPQAERGKTGGDPVDDGLGRVGKDRRAACQEERRELAGHHHDRHQQAHGHHDVPGVALHPRIIMQGGRSRRPGQPRIVSKNLTRGHRVQPCPPAIDLLLHLAHEIGVLRIEQVPEPTTHGPEGLGDRYFLTLLLRIDP